MFNEIISPILSIINKVIPDPAQRDAAKQKLLELQQQGDLQELQEMSKVIVAEAQSDSWLAKSWRPITMLSFVAILINNYILVPYVNAFGGHIPMLALPPDMWALLQIGLAGYVLSRGIEKSVATFSASRK